MVRDCFTESDGQGWLMVFITLSRPAALQSAPLYHWAKVSQSSERERLQNNCSISIYTVQSIVICWFGPPTRYMMKRESISWYSIHLIDILRNNLTCSGQQLFQCFAKCKIFPALISIIWLETALVIIFYPLSLILFWDKVK